MLSLRSHCDEFPQCSTLCLASFIWSRDHGESMGEGPMVDSEFVSTPHPSLDNRFQDSPGENKLRDFPFHSSIDDRGHGLQERKM